MNKNVIDKDISGTNKNLGCMYFSHPILCCVRVSECMAWMFVRLNRMSVVIDWFFKPIENEDEEEEVWKNTIKNQKKNWKQFLVVILIVFTVI